VTRWFAKLGPGLMLAAAVAPYYKPATSLLVWYWIGFAVMSALAIAFFVERLS